MFDLHHHIPGCLAPPPPFVPSSFRAEPVSNEHVIFFPGGKAMVFDWGVESFAKNVLSVVIAGGVLVGAGVGALIWADKRLKKQAPSAVTVQRAHVPKDDAEEEVDTDSEEESLEDN